MRPDGSDGIRPLVIIGVNCSSQVVEDVIQALIIRKEPAQLFDLVPRRHNPMPHNE